MEERNRCDFASQLQSSLSQRGDNKARGRIRLEMNVFQERCEFLWRPVIHPLSHLMFWFRWVQHSTPPDLPHGDYRTTTHPPRLRRPRCYERSVQHTTRDQCLQNELCDLTSVSIAKVWSSPARRNFVTTVPFCVSFLLPGETI